MDYKYLTPFEQEEFEFNGAHCYSIARKSFLISNCGTSIVLSSNIVDTIIKKNISEDLAFKLYQRSFGKVFNKERFENQLFEIKPTLFMIDFTTKCNCNCIYCLRHFENVGESISFGKLQEITHYIIEYCYKHNVKHISFQPWGGEPLIEIDKIIECKKMFDNAGIHANFNIQTNGLLLTLANYEKLRQHNIEIGVSIDGIDAVHDAHRLDVRGNKTHKKIVANLKAIRQAYPDCNIGTLSVNSVYSKEHIADNIDYLVSQLGLSNIKFNLVHPSGSDSFDESMLIKKQDLITYIDDLLNAVINQIKNGNRCYEANITDKLFNILNQLSNNICNSMGCRGGISFVSFDRDGNIYPCEMIGKTALCLGNVSDDKDLIELIKKAHDDNPYYLPRKVECCNGCPFFFYCRGGCKACSLAYGKEACDIDEIECEINKALYPKLIELILIEPKLVEKIIDNRVTME